MGQTLYRANLSAKDWSFTADKWGRTVILKQYDQNFSRQVVSPADPDKDIGIPQIFYCHNVMPGSGGFQSIYYIVQTALALQAGGMKWIHWTVNSTNLQTAYLSYTVLGDGFISIYALRSDNVWAFVTKVAWTATGEEQVSSATVNGQTYVYIPYVGCYIYDPSANTFTTQALTGLTLTSIIGLIGSYGYLIVYGPSNVSWSSTVDPTDFTPSLITGAGGGSVQDIQGQITFCQHQLFGFVVFSKYNAVAAVYSGNAQFPFNYRPIVGCGGLSDPELCDVDPETGNLYAWTTSGLQLVGYQQANAVFPDMSNFISGNIMEDFNDITLEFNSQKVPIGTLKKRISVVGERYFVLSYGVVNFTHALIYDIAMKRWGKLKILHERIFTYIDPDLPTSQQARNSLRVFTEYGVVYQVRFDIQESASGGTLILGKYQHTRNRLITIQEVDPENIISTSQCNVYVVTTLDGKTPEPPVLLVPTTPIAGQAPIYPARVTGVNFSLIFQGAFDLDSLVLSYIPNGRR